MSSRKRRAPGASPQLSQPQNNSMFTQQDADQFMNNWVDPSAGADITPAFGDPSLYDFSGMGTSSGPSSHNRIVSLDGLDNSTATDSAFTGQLVRRNPNQQIAARGRTPWDNFNNANPGQWEGAEEEDDDELEQKALLARKDAQTKRKQIPPFVQKLSSFLDNNKNTNLIRWSDDGNSFIVLDEDEFARTLIPELFKHNNYASFVRQLNMYGFHKKVGLSDNSMKASEAKAKAPSEYYNKYFKRGRSELLWLIQKPKNPSGAPKRKREDEGKQGDSDDERKFTQDPGVAYGEDGLTLRNNQDMALIPRAEYNSLRSEVRTLQQQQKVISNVLAQIRRQNDQLYQQATAFQTLHDRHENSINAILTFLATFYNRTLEGNNNGPNLADIFGPSMAPQQSHGSVVDVGDYPEPTIDKSPQMPRPPRRPLALLPAPMVKESMTPTDRAATISPSNRPTPNINVPKTAARQTATRSPVPPPQTINQQQTKNASNVTQPSPPFLKVETESPTPNLGQVPENDEIMSAIQNANANASQSASQTPQFDFPAALANYQAQDGHVPLTQQQRNDVLSMMANNASAASPNSTLAQNSNNAMVSPQPPAMPDLSQFEATQQQLDLLQKMSEEQGSRVQSLQERLQPLSPSGSIPGLDGGYFNSAVGDPGQFDLDLDPFIPNEDYMTSNAHNGDNINAPDLDIPDLYNQLDSAASGIDVPGANEDLLGFDEATRNRVESVSSSAASPAVTVEDADDDNGRSPKRRRR
ncbi:hypothetical protein BU24DRAFT_464922 [Aaosphaeria arxii CBS 175.79]|uniref:HSF-type DNA-binding domain-containing protein n=1 Tax=Aaosphaeria arxii CBS 175.79 TaxID=1450172 RepID=A0A6A5XI36_9PLEO|nr:uncharacterized protein BU24DRAFT_464922 [Aaosphaeria arxii CBS 175.79]KAF2012539.1 hypothetical protein BU24DRAFT_464922 [Aaosphaeria arxii CBS 175.79]